MGSFLLVLIPHSRIGSLGFFNSEGEEGSTGNEWEDLSSLFISRKDFFSTSVIRRTKKKRVTFEVG